jgi:hypothetical protein
MRLREWHPQWIGAMWMYGAAAQLVALFTVPPLVGWMFGGGPAPDRSTGGTFGGIIADIALQFQALLSVLIIPPLVMAAVTLTWAVQRRRRAGAG